MASSANDSQSDFHFGFRFLNIVGSHLNTEDRESRVSPVFRLKLKTKVPSPNDLSCLWDIKS